AQDSPYANPLYAQQRNPARLTYQHERNRYRPTPGQPGSGVYPYVVTTYRLTEHFTAGGMTRWVPYLAELQPELFCEVSPELAAERSLVHGEWATIVTPRNAIEARVLVTDRLTPLRTRAGVVQQIGLPYHWGSNGLSTGETADTRTRSSGWASSPTPACASAARPARSPARSGTRSPTTASTGPACPTTTPASSARTPGDTSRSSSNASLSATRGPPRP